MVTAKKIQPVGSHLRLCKEPAYLHHKEMGHRGSGLLKAELRAHAAQLRWCFGQSKAIKTLYE